MSNVMEERRNVKKPVMASLPAAPSWVEELRRAGKGQFEAVGYPVSPKIEAWRHTNIRPVVETQWHPAVADEAAARVLANRYTLGQDAIEVVISNGHYSQTLSRLGELPAGVSIEPLSSASTGPNAEVVKKHLGSRAKIDRNPFVALNQAHLNGGVFVHIKKGVALTRPIHVICAATPDEVPAVNHPRILVVLEDAAQATLVQSYVGPVKGEYFTNAVSEIIVGADAIVDHYKLNQESNDALHVATMEVIIGAKAQFIDHNATIGSRITRNDIAVRLNGEYAYSVLNGLTLAGGEQFIDNHTLLEHAYPNCPSYELYKHVLDGKAQGIFKGQIYVHDVAQKTDAKQNSKTLLLSDDAQMNSQPALEIYADDVKCTHGSTTGPVDEAMKFYLQTRGLSEAQSQQLLIYAFAADVTRRIKVEPVRARLESFMAAQHDLPQDFRIQELGGHDDDVVY
jgi:Fe-S cluster assembly protein SufD